MFKCFKFVVVSSSRSIGLFPVVTAPGLFMHWDRDAFRAVFGDTPVLYRLSHAQFMVRELRRSGYYVSVRPYVLYMLRDALLSLRSRLIRRRDSSSAWRK